MRKVLSATVVAVLLTFAIPASASAVDRQIATAPDIGGQANGYLRAFRFNPSANYQTWISSCCYVPDISKPWYSVGRPASDLYAADRGASHFWPGCSHTWYGSNDQRAQTGFYYTFFHINC